MTEIDWKARAKAAEASTASLLEEVERLKGATLNLSEALAVSDDRRDTAEAQRDALSVKLTALEGALTPVIATVNAVDGVYGFPDDKPVNTRDFGPPYNEWPSFNWGDLRTIRQALSDLPRSPGGGEAKPFCPLCGSTRREVRGNCHDDGGGFGRCYSSWHSLVGFGATAADANREGVRPVSRCAICKNGPCELGTCDVPL